MAEGRLIILSAPSGAGKTTLAHRVISRLQDQGQSARFSVSYTTRAPRPGERDGIDYHFVEKSAFMEMVQAGGMLEHAEVFGRCYGTGLSATRDALAQGEILFLDIDWQGARQIKAKLPQHCCSVFVLPPSREALRERLSGRGQDSEDVINARMAEAQAEISHYDEFDHVINNDELETAVQQLLAICLQQPVRGCRVADHAELAQALLS